jgi:ADP-ribose pyrophosphatase
VFIQHPESVAIVAVDGDELVVVRQTRPGASEKTLELPSGKLEDGETPEEAMSRELAEECGLAARSWRRIGSFWAAPAYSTELVHVFEASELSIVKGSLLDADEDVETERVHVDEALTALSDAVSIAALALSQDRTTR